MHLLKWQLEYNFEMLKVRKGHIYRPMNVKLWKQCEQLYLVSVSDQHRSRIKTWAHLVDLIHHSKGAAVELLQGHEVKHCGDAALSSTLMVRRQLVELSAAVELDPDADPILVILLLQKDNNNAQESHQTCSQEQLEV